MAEVTVSEDCSARTLPRGPNKKKYDEEYAACQNAIRLKESEIKTLSARMDEIRPELEVLRSNRISLNQQRQSNHDNLSKVGQEIVKLEAELARVQSSLQYRNEAKINDAIHSFETQLRIKNFSLIEEKKIVAEIDSLKRSKKNLGAYLTLKRQTDEKREHAKQLREQREKLHKEFTAVKRREEEVRVEWHTGQEQLAKLKQEISDQNKKLNGLRKEFSEQEKLYNEQRRKHMQQIHRAKVEERKAAVEAHQHEIAEIEASVDPAESDRQLCTMLIKYLQRFVAADDDHDNKSSPSSSLQFLSPHDSVEMDGMVRLQKKLDDKEQFSKTKVPKKNKKDKKRIDVRKRLVHTPEIFSQFAQFGLVPPNCSAEVAPVIEQLMNHFSSLGVPVSAPSISCDYTPLNDALPPLSALSDSSDAVLPPQAAAENVPSSAASYNGSSIPTTPDVQFDMVTAPCLSLASCDSSTTDSMSSAIVADVTVAPFVSATEQRLSQDSGTESDDLSTQRADSGSASVE